MVGHPKVRVALVHHHPRYLAQMREVVTAAPDFELAGTETSGLAGVRMIAELRPELIFVSLHLPDKRTRTFIARVKSIDPAIRVIVVSPLTDRVGPRIAAGKGADGYICKARLTLEMRNLLARYHEFAAAWGTRFSPWKDNFGMA
jgi:DNA-binding NarL/FixJ family response regulator